MMEIVKNIFRSSIEAVLPNKLIHQAIKIKKLGKKEFLEIRSTNDCFELNHNVYIVAFGKAACGMSSAAETVLSDHLVKGIASIPVGSIEVLRTNKLCDMLPLDNSKIEYREGSKDNIPDSNAQKTAQNVKQLCTNLKASDLLLVLISGGGSALLPCPPDSVSLQDKTTVIKMLSSRGACISELNTVRQQLSDLKAGGLAQFAYPAKVISLIFSDIIGNDLQFVASGPTVKCTTNPQDALNIMKKFCSDDEIPNDMKTYLSSKSKSIKNDSESQRTFDHVTNILLADNRIALESAKMYSESLKVPSIILSNEISGEAKEIGRLFARFTSDLVNLCNEKDTKIDFEQRFPSLFSKVGSSLKQNFYQFLMDQWDFDTHFCLLWGGETTVSVKGKGKGGRNQELVLAFLSEARALNLAKAKLDFVFCSAGTDGQDGPTDAAGALIDKQALNDDYKIEDEDSFLNNNDSYNFFQKFLNGRYHLKCRLTGTNVMDVQILYVSKSPTLS